MTPLDPILPLGVLDLDPHVQIDPGPPLRIRCFAQDCQAFLLPPTRGTKGEVCPVHHIRAHRSGTYTYPDPRRNIIVAKDLLATRIVGHRFKVETHRFGYERSEDALTFNVLRSFQEAGCLSYIARYITGLDIDDEPRLYLWGLNLSDDSLQPWDLLIAARKRFKRRLPVKRPKTEPDIGLWLPGQYLILTEAKFTSPNTFYTAGERKDSQSLTKDELLNIYSDLSLRILDRAKAIQSERIFYQLWRNMVFAEWMAQADGPDTRAFLGNLTRFGCENESASEFARMIRPEFADRFTHLRWEDLYVLAGLRWRDLCLLRDYFLTKTASLVPAFNLGYF